jgi:integrase/recombinase XerD
MKKKRPPDKQKEILNDYQHHLCEVVGVSPKTCQDHVREISRFFEAVVVGKKVPLANLGGVELTDYLRLRSANCRPASLRQVAGSLRQFLRFTEAQGWTSPCLSLAVPKIACRAHDLPAYLSQEELDRLLASWDASTAAGQRDFAIAICLARLGMRAGEVGALLLDDIDWRCGIVRLRQTKNGSPAELPLLAEVGEAIVRYLQKGRPPCNHRHVFVHHEPPVPMNGNAISRVIRRALEHCGVRVARGGAHLLRHTLASQLVQNGASLKEVADVLRHRHLNSAAIYAHIDLPQLRPLALPWPKEVPL